MRKIQAQLLGHTMCCDSVILRADHSVWVTKKGTGIFVWGGGGVRGGEQPQRCPILPGHGGQCEVQTFPSSRRDLLAPRLSVPILSSQPQGVPFPSQTLHPSPRGISPTLCPLPGQRAVTLPIPTLCPLLCEVLPGPTSALVTPGLLSRTGLQAPGAKAMCTNPRCVRAPAQAWADQAHGQHSLSEDRSTRGRLRPTGLALLPVKDPPELGLQRRVRAQFPRSRLRERQKDGPAPGHSKAERSHEVPALDLQRSQL